MTNDQEYYPLGEDEIELIAIIQREAAVLHGRLIGILDSFVRGNNLEGRWEIAPNGREVRRVITCLPTPKGVDHRESVPPSGPMSRPSVKSP